MPQLRDNYDFYFGGKNEIFVAVIACVLPFLVKNFRINGPKCCSVPGSAISVPNLNHEIISHLTTTCIVVMMKCEQMTRRICAK